MSLKKNLSWNIAGNVIPVIAAFYCIPRLISNIGDEKFGTLLVVLIVIGYAGILDLGLGRALTKSISDCLQSGRESEVYTVAWTGLTVLGYLGCAISSLAFLVFELGSHGYVPLLSSLNKDLSGIVGLLLLCLPMVFLTSGIRSLLEAIHRFDLVNQIRIPVGISNYVVPLLISVFSTNLYLIVLGLTVSRLMTLIIHYAVWTKSYAQYRGHIKFDRGHLASLLKFGGWISVSSIVGPLILYADRFIVSGVVSAKFFAYYATPYELTSKIWLVPTAYAGVLFPIFAQGAFGNYFETRKTYLRSLLIISAMLVPVCLVLYFFSFELLSWWISDTFARNSHEVLSILSLGVLVNSLAQIPFTFIQAIGRPALTAKVHLGTLVPYLLILWLMTQSYGIIGAATSWSARILVTSILFFLIAERHFKNTAQAKEARGDHEYIDSQPAYQQFRR